MVLQYIVRQWKLTNLICWQLTINSIMHSAKCERSTKEKQRPIIAELFLCKIFQIINWLLLHVCKSKNLPRKRDT